MRLTAPAPDYTPQLRQLMQLRGILTFKALCQQAQVSERQVLNLRRGQWHQLRVATLAQIGQVLAVSIADLVHLFSAPTAPEPEKSPDELVIAPSDDRFEQEYHRLNQQLIAQEHQLWQKFQQTSLQTLEPWLWQWSAAAYAVQQNPQLPATKLMPLVRPIEQLLQQWHVTAFVTVGTEIAYDPQWHQLMNGTATRGDRVRVRYAGYCHGEKLLCRAQVSPV